MRKITVYDIAEERLVGYDDKVEKVSLGLTPFLKKKDAVTFIDRSYSKDYPLYYNFREKHSIYGNLTYIKKKIEIFDSVEDYDKNAMASILDELSK